MRAGENSFKRLAGHAVGSRGPLGTSQARGDRRGEARRVGHLSGANFSLRQWPIAGSPDLD